MALEVVIIILLRKLMQLAAHGAMALETLIVCLQDRIRLVNV